MVLVDDLLWYNFYGDAHEFGAIHRCVEVEVGNVHRGVPSIWGGNGAVDVTLYGGHVNGWCAGGPVKVVVVVCHSKTDSVFLCFKRFERSNNTNVANGSVFGDMLEGYSMDGFGSVWSEAFEFVAPTLFP